MSRRSSTPYTPQKRLWCDGLVIEVGTPDMSPRQALRLARQVVRKRLSGDWSVEPLGREARDFAVTKLPGRRRIEGAKAWDLAARLQKDRNVSRAEPSFILPGVDASPEQVLPDIEARGMTRLELKELPCSRDPEWTLSVCEVQAPGISVRRRRENDGAKESSSAIPTPVTPIIPRSRIRRDSWSATATTSKTTTAIPPTRSSA